MGLFRNNSKRSNIGNRKHYNINDYLLMKTNKNNHNWKLSLKIPRNSRVDSSIVKGSFARDSFNKYFLNKILKYFFLSWTERKVEMNCLIYWRSSNMESTRVAYIACNFSFVHSSLLLSLFSDSKGFTWLYVRCQDSYSLEKGTYRQWNQWKCVRWANKFWTLAVTDLNNFNVTSV